MSSSSSTELPVIKLKRRISRVAVNAITELLQNKVKNWQNVSLYCDICDSLIAQLLCSPICSHGSLLFTPGIRFFSKFMQRWSWSQAGWSRDGRSVSRHWYLVIPGKPCHATHRRPSQSDIQPKTEHLEIQEKIALLNSRIPGKTRDSQSTSTCKLHLYLAKAWQKAIGKPFVSLKCCCLNFVDIEVAFCIKFSIQEALGRILCTYNVKF